MNHLHVIHVDQCILYFMHIHKPNRSVDKIRGFRLALIYSASCNMHLTIKLLVMIPLIEQLLRVTQKMKYAAICKYCFQAKNCTIFLTIQFLVTLTG